MSGIIEDSREEKRRAGRSAMRVTMAGFESADSSKAEEIGSQGPEDSPRAAAAASLGPLPIPEKLSHRKRLMRMMADAQMEPWKSDAMKSAMGLKGIIPPVPSVSKRRHQSQIRVYISHASQLPRVGKSDPEVVVRVDFLDKHSSGDGKSLGGATPAKRSVNPSWQGLSDVGSNVFYSPPGMQVSAVILRVYGSAGGGAELVQLGSVKLKDEEIQAYASADSLRPLRMILTPPKQKLSSLVLGDASKPQLSGQSSDQLNRLIDKHFQPGVSSPIAVEVEGRLYASVCKCPVVGPSEITFRRLTLLSKLFSDASLQFQLPSGPVTTPRGVTVDSCNFSFVPQTVRLTGADHSQDLYVAAISSSSAPRRIWGAPFCAFASITVSSEISPDPPLVLSFDAHTRRITNSLPVPVRFGSGHLLRNLMLDSQRLCLPPYLDTDPTLAELLGDIVAALPPNKAEALTPFLPAVFLGSKQPDGSVSRLDLETSLKDVLTSSDAVIVLDIDEEQVVVTRSKVARFVHILNTVLDILGWTSSHSIYAIIVLISFLMYWGFSPAWLLLLLPGLMCLQKYDLERALRIQHRKDSIPEGFVPTTASEPVGWLQTLVQAAWKLHHDEVSLFLHDKLNTLLSTVNIGGLKIAIRHLALGDIPITISQVSHICTGDRYVIEAMLTWTPSEAALVLLRASWGLTQLTVKITDFRIRFRARITLGMAKFLGLAQGSGNPFTRLRLQIIDSEPEVSLSVKPEKLKIDLFEATGICTQIRKVIHELLHFMLIEPRFVEIPLNPTAPPLCDGVDTPRSTSPDEPALAAALPRSGSSVELSAAALPSADLSPKPSLVNDSSFSDLSTGSERKSTGSRVRAITSNLLKPLNAVKGLPSVNRSVTTQANQLMFSALPVEADDEPDRLVPTSEFFEREISGHNSLLESMPYRDCTSLIHFQNRMRVASMQSASLNQLVLVTLEGDFASDTHRAFLHRAYLGLSPDHRYQAICLLTDLYLADLNEGPSTPPLATHCQSQVPTLICYLMTEYFAEYCELCDKFIRTVDASNAAAIRTSATFRQVRAIYDQQAAAVPRPKPSSSNAHLEPVKLPGSSIKHWHFHEVDSQEIAHQLTLSHHALLATVPKSELTLQSIEAFNSGKHLQAASAPHLHALFAAAEELSGLIYAMATCAKKKSKSKSKELLLKWLDVAQHCIDCRNWFGAAAVWQGIKQSMAKSSSQPISAFFSKLENMTGTTEKNLQNRAKAFAELFDSDFGIAYLSSLHLKPTEPRIPYVAALFKELSIWLGEPDIFPSGLINVQKLLAMASLLEEIKYAQEASYAYQPAPKFREYFDGLLKDTKDDSSRIASKLSI